jgi:hypothetical protein
MFISEIMIATKTDKMFLNREGYSRLHESSPGGFTRLSDQVAADPGRRGASMAPDKVARRRYIGLPRYFRKPSGKAAGVSPRPADSLRPARDAFLLRSASLSEAGRSRLRPGLLEGLEGRRRTFGDRLCARASGLRGKRGLQVGFEGYPCF